MTFFFEQHPREIGASCREGRYAALI